MSEELVRAVDEWAQAEAEWSNRFTKRRLGTENAAQLIDRLQARTAALRKASEQRRKRAMQQPKQREFTGSRGVLKKGRSFPLRRQ